MVFASFCFYKLKKKIPFYQSREIKKQGLIFVHTWASMKNGASGAKCSVSVFAVLTVKPWWYQVWQEWLLFVISAFQW